MAASKIPTKIKEGIVGKVPGLEITPCLAKKAIKQAAPYSKSAPLIRSTKVAIAPSTAATDHNARFVGSVVTMSMLLRSGRLWSVGMLVMSLRCAVAVSLAASRCTVTNEFPSPHAPTMRKPKQTINPMVEKIT